MFVVTSQDGGGADQDGGGQGRRLPAARGPGGPPAPGETRGTCLGHMKKKLFLITVRVKNIGRIEKN